MNALKAGPFMGVLLGCVAFGDPSGPGAEPGSVENRLRDLEFPELRQRDPREIEILEELVGVREETLKRVAAMYKVGQASALDLAKADYARHAARAELAYAEHRVHDAVEELVRASESAERWVKAAKAFYEAGAATIDVLLEGQARLAQAKLAVVRAEKVAKAAGVDTSDIAVPDVGTDTGTDSGPPAPLGEPAPPQGLGPGRTLPPPGPRLPGQE